MPAHRFAAALCALALLLAGPHSSAFGAACGPAWTWWTRPIAQQVSGHVVSGGVNAQGEVTVDGRLVDVTQGDDHDAPAIVIRAGLPTLVFYSEHDVVDRLYYRIGLTGDRRELTLPGQVTYAQALTYGQQLVVLTRAGGCRWYALVSRDWAQTFAAPQLLLDGCRDGKQIYLTTKAQASNSHIYRLALYGHPDDSTWREVDYGLLNVATGRVWSPGHSQVANLYSGAGLPLVKGSLDVAVPAQAGSRLFDVGETAAGDPLIVYARWSTTAAPRYATARYDRSKGTWVQSATLPGTGQPFWAKARYYGGGAISADGTLVLSREAAGTWYLERYRLVIGKGWVKAAVLAHNSLPIVRPYAVTGTANEILAQRLVRYESFTDFCVEPFTVR